MALIILTNVLLLKYKTLVLVDPKTSESKYEIKLFYLITQGSKRGRVRVILKEILQ